MGNFTKLFILVGFIGISMLSRAQVGINVDDPNPAAILHIESDTLGVLFPSIENLADVGEVNGLFIFRTSDNKFYYYNEDSVAWVCLNPLYAEEDYNATLNGDLTIDGGNVTVRGGNINVEPENTISGYGTVPQGGIIMWSGEHDRIPDGWALCNGDLVEGIQTPDLRGRFVVGHSMGDGTSNDPRYNPSDSKNNAVSNAYQYVGLVGGDTTIFLSEANIPNHAHEMNHNHILNDPGHYHEIRTGRNGGNGEITKQDAHNRAQKTTDINTTGITINPFNGNTGDWGGAWQEAIYGPPNYTGSECKYDITKEGCTDVYPYEDDLTIVADCDGYYPSKFEPFEDPESGHIMLIKVLPTNENFFVLNTECKNDDWNPSYGERDELVPAHFGVTPVENRPPYYVIAFIIRVK